MDRTSVFYSPANAAQSKSSRSAKYFLRFNSPKLEYHKGQNVNAEEQQRLRLQKYLQDRGVSVSRYLKPSPEEIASAVERMVLPVDPNFEKDQTNDAGTLIIHDMVIPDPFSLKTVNNFNSSPPLGVVRYF